MNRTLSVGLVAASLLLCLVVAIAMAGQFDPVFRVLRFKGICQVAPPGSSEFGPVKTSKAYPFGSTIRTGDRDSEATISLCENHECRMASNTTARFTDEAQDRENRTVHLVAGKVEVDLDRSEPKFIKYTNRVFVQTAVAIAAGEKTKFTVTASRDKDIHEALFECNAGMLGVSGAQFQTPVVKEGASLKVTGPADLSWLRVQTVRGEIPYDVRNEFAEPVTYATKPGAAIKINQRVTDVTKVRHVAIRTMKSDGTTETNYYYRIGPQAKEEVVPPAAPAAPAAPAQPAPQQGI